MRTLDPIPATGTGAILLLTGALLGACQPTGPSRVDVSADTAAGEVGFDLAGATDAAILLPVTLNGQGPFDFVLDTGATLTCVTPTLADSLRLPERGGAQGFGAGVGGSGRVEIVAIDSVQVGGIRAYDVTACVVDLGQMGTLGFEVHGLLGLNFLKPFRVGIDFERNVLSLESPGGEPRGGRSPAGEEPAERPAPQ